MSNIMNIEIDASLPRARARSNARGADEASGMSRDCTINLDWPVPGKENAGAALQREPGRKNFDVDHIARRATARNNINEKNRGLRGDLIGSNQATAAAVVATGHAPVTKLCRQLIEAGHDPALPLEVYRGTTLCLRVHSIGQGARLTVEDNNIGRPRFVRHRPRIGGAAPPIAPNGEG
jgi:hypothetical protein